VPSQPHRRRSGAKPTSVSCVLKRCAIAPAIGGTPGGLQVCVCCRGIFRQPAPVLAPRHCRLSPKQELREDFAAVYDNEQGYEGQSWTSTS
jgi:hypothetical protein